MVYRIGKVAVLIHLLLQFTQGAEWIVPDQHPTIQAALVVAVSGDVVLVRPGTYRENLNFLGKNVVLRGMEGADATILDARRGVGILIGPGGTVEGFTVENAYGSFGAAVRVSGSGTVIRDNVFAGNEQEVGGFGAAIGGNGASPIIERNLFRDNHADDQHLSGVVCFVNTSSPLIVNNVFVSNPTRAINLTLPQESRPVVINNTLVGNSVGIRLDARVPTDQQTLRNNLLFNNGIGLELSFVSADSMPLWEHNLVFGGLVLYEGMDNPTGQQGNLSVDPRFRDASTGDFRLRPDSPAIDAGTPTDAPATDFLNRPRPVDGDLDETAQVDMGAFELIPEPPSPALGLTGISGMEKVTLSWQPSPDAESYEVRRATVSGGPFETLEIVSGPEYVDETVSDGIEYYFVVVARNRFGESAPSTEIIVIPGNRPPLGVDDEATTPEDTPVVIAVLANDSDPDGDDIVLVSADPPQNGGVEVHADGTITYTPAPDFHGMDEFAYWIGDSSGLESTARVTLTVTPVNDPPTAIGQFLSFIGDAPFPVELKGGDLDGDPLTYLVLAPPVHGLLSGFDPQTGSVSYTPAHGFSGTDQFTFLVSDGLSNSAPATVQLAVSPPRDVDGNGLPDYWEVAHDVKNRNDDRDLDGSTNRQEYIANTNPRDPASVLRILSLERNPDGHFVLTWASVGAVRYRIQFDDGAANGSFQGTFVDIPRPVLDEMDANQSGTPAVISFTDDFSLTGDPPPSGVRYYRIRVVR